SSSGGRSPQPHLLLRGRRRVLSSLGIEGSHGALRPAAERWFPPPIESPVHDFRRGACRRRPTSVTGTTSAAPEGPAVTSAPVSAHAPAPSSASAPAVAPPRSLAPDVARGLMLALIAVANVCWYLWRSSESAGGTPHIPADGPLDSIAQAVMTVAVD